MVSRLCSVKCGNVLDTLDNYVVVATASENVDNTVAAPENDSAVYFILRQN